MPYQNYLMLPNIFLRNIMIILIHSYNINLIEILKLNFFDLTLLLINILLKIIHIYFIDKGNYLFFKIFFTFLKIEIVIIWI